MCWPALAAVSTGLTILVNADRVVLYGQTATYHVKQLAQHGVRELLPDFALETLLS